jgi:hypothetical protein
MITLRIIDEKGDLLLARTVYQVPQVGELVSLSVLEPGRKVTGVWWDFVDAHTVARVMIK